MAHVVYLSPDQAMPDHGEDAAWIMIEASAEGRFFGTGAGSKSDGKSVFYISLTENDGSLETALTAAQKWAEEKNVATIWVQLQPQSEES